MYRRQRTQKNHAHIICIIEWLDIVRFESKTSHITCTCMNEWGCYTYVCMHVWMNEWRHLDSRRYNRSHLWSHPSVGTSLGCHCNTHLWLDTSNPKISYFDNLESDTPSHTHLTHSTLNIKEKDLLIFYYLMLINQKIFCFEISMDDIGLMQIIHSFRDINCNLDQIWHLQYTALLVHIVMHTPTWHELCFHHQMENWWEVASTYPSVRYKYGVGSEPVTMHSLGGRVQAPMNCTTFLCLTFLKDNQYIMYLFSLKMNDTPIFINGVLQKHLKINGLDRCILYY